MFFFFSTDEAQASRHHYQYGLSGLICSFDHDRLLVHELDRVAEEHRGDPNSSTQVRAWCLSFVTISSLERICNFVTRRSVDQP